MPFELRAAVLVGIIASVSGCAATGDTAGHDRGHGVTPTASTTPAPSSAPSELTVTPAPGEPRIATLSSTRGSASTEPAPTRTGRAAVYIRCYGDDIITVEIENSATITQRCLLDAGDPGTRNTLDIVGEEVRVTGTGDVDNLWAIAVTEIPAD
ncbi:hypothetical protein LJR045_002679 [Microbacterium sp. LjRoot45]|uniref:hypothetical protein n=1 Tax=Microbacterium sp. LjRoot45 TaxID=3342329 RepID=UPI003ECE3F2F